MLDGVRFFRLTDKVATSPQVDAAAMAEIAAQGDEVVINNRPVNEAPGQPDAESLRIAAETAGLEYHHFPVNAFNYPGEHIETMRDLFDGDRRVLAFCRSGTRSANLWISSRDETEKDEARERAQRLGVDTSMSLG